MIKPSTIIYEEFKQELATLINKSGLPAFVIEPVLREYLNETREAMQRQYAADKAAYERALAEQASEQSE